jgi:hypothetical protein
VEGIRHRSRVVTRSKGSLADIREHALHLPQHKIRHALFFLGEVRDEKFRASSLDNGFGIVWHGGAGRDGLRQQWRWHGATRSAGNHDSAAEPGGDRRPDGYVQRDRKRHAA